MELFKNYKRLNNDRIDFSKISGTYPLPHLVEIQTNSFKWFLEKGMTEIFQETFPIKSNNNITLEFLECHLEEANHTPLECKSRNLTYSKPLKATFRLTYASGDSSLSGDVKSSLIHLGDLPVMTDNGTFIVNGLEKVSVSQIVRSSGAYLKIEEKGDKVTYKCELIPVRGTWLEFSNDTRGVINIHIDKERGMPASIFFKAIGFTKKEYLIDLFGEHDFWDLTFAKDGIEWESDTRTPDRVRLDGLREIFKKLKPSEPITDNGVKNLIITKFFDKKRVDISNSGRYKYNKKLGPYNRLIGRMLAEDLVDTMIFNEDGEIVDSKLLFEAGHVLTKEDISYLKDIKYFERGNHRERLKYLNTDLDTHCDVYNIKVYNNEEEKKVCSIIANDILNVDKTPTYSDMIAIFSYFLNIMDGFGEVDDIDNLTNRRIRCVGELLQEQFRKGLTKMAKSVGQKMTTATEDQITLQYLLNVKVLGSTIKEFFNNGQICQQMDQVNPLSELSNKRRITALGPGGLTKDTAKMEVRDVHFTHYGRICPIETPEGQNIGLVSNLACYAKTNEYGFLVTPYRRVIHENRNGENVAIVTDTTDLLSADQERNHYVAQANTNFNTETGVILDEKVFCRYDGENKLVDRSKVDYIDVSPKQVLSVATSCIPFLQNDDNHRALMGANMQRQALPLLRPEAPFVGTGMEHVVATDSGLAVLANNEGDVIYADGKVIKVKNTAGTIEEYTLQKFRRSNDGTCINQQCIVKAGQHVKRGQVLADGPAMQNGDLALGQNIVVAFTAWDGYNFEDAVVMSQRLVKTDAYTSIYIVEYEIECRDISGLGPEVITKDIFGKKPEELSHLDNNGIVSIGSEVKEGMILVGKITPKAQSESLPNDQIFKGLFNEKNRDTKDTSLKVPHSGGGIVIDVKVFNRDEDELPPNVIKKVSVFVAQRRKISEGDKMSGRHGNKGVISRILPEEDMPYLPDGTPVDILLNPCGVPSRMNIGQVLELHVGYACKKLGLKIATPVFDGMTIEEINKMCDAAGLSPDRKTVLYDGRTGDRFDERISVGVMYMIKLNHMVDDKLHARSTGPYALVVQQPLGGKAQNGGQRFGEMEVWALEAYGASHILQEMLTLKSDDKVGRERLYGSIIKGTEMPKPSMPEAFKVFVKELKSLALNITLYDQNDQEIDMDELARQAAEDERRAKSFLSKRQEIKVEEDNDLPSITKVVADDYDEN